MSDLVQEWYATFIDPLEIEPLVEIIIAANFLDIACLLNLCNAKLASKIKGKTAEEIKDIFKVTAPYTAPDEDMLRAKYPWAEYPNCIVPTPAAEEAKK